MKKLLILGSTGSIGTQTLEIVRHHPNEFDIVGLCANSNYKLLNQQIAEFSPKTCCIADEKLSKFILKGKSKLYSSSKGIIDMCNDCGADIVVSAIVGLAGLEPTLACIDKGMIIALANKETLVGGGRLVTNRLKKSSSILLPVDSEHSAIYQCIQNEENRAGIKNIYITASGGPFHGFSKDQLSNVSLKQALKHPNWSMGAKVTIDSATLMNKGLEVIEAKWLFNLKPDQIKVAIHKKSIVHSMVEYKDNSILAQLGIPSMKIPIQYALMYPKRLSCPCEALDIFSMGALEFLQPDYDAFPCLAIAFSSLRDGNSRSLVINSANEVAVSAFLKNKIKFTDIYNIIEQSYVKIESINEDSLENILALDYKTRVFAEELVNKYQE